MPLVTEQQQYLQHAYPTGNMAGYMRFQNGSAVGYYSGSQWVSPCTVTDGLNIPSLQDVLTKQYERNQKQLHEQEFNKLMSDLDKVMKEPKKEKNMTKYYRTLKDLPYLEVGAILASDNIGYRPVSDLWNKDEQICLSDSYYEFAKVVEKSPEWFERVYEVSIDGDKRYLTKSEAQKVFADAHAPKGTK